MILTFVFADTIVKVKIDGHSVTFANADSNYLQFVPINCLRLTEEGILKEHPDLKDKPFGEMKKIAIERFKKFVSLLSNEETIKDYVIKELQNSGYKLKLVEKNGFRPQVIK